ncbi:MAG: hypothetical protein RSD85_02170, partial [Erysipelotrichaceae bacterium]
RVVLDSIELIILERCLPATIFIFIYSFVYKQLYTGKDINASTKMQPPIFVSPLPFLKESRSPGALFN